MTTQILPSYICGNWKAGQAIHQLALNALTQEPIFEISSQGFDFSQILHYAKSHSALLRDLTFHQRAMRITALAKHLNGLKKKYYPISMQSGATLADSKIDIDGGIQTLFAVSSLARRGLPDEKVAYEKGHEMLSKNATFIGKHLLVPKHGVAVLINAFNFPCWGMLEKLASAFIAGVPVIVKPASITSYIAQAVAQDIISSEILPMGSFQIINGSLGNMFDLLDEQDAISLTGSAHTANLLKAHPNLLQQSIPFYAEADSLNFAMLSEQAVPDDEEFTACIEEIAQELTTKAGQRCTCIRRIFVPETLLEDFQKKLKMSLAQIKIGDPAHDQTQLGSLVGKSQKDDVLAGLQELQQQASLVFDGSQNEKLGSAEVLQKGAFVPPMLLLDEAAASKENLVHQKEIFGPVATLIPYANLDEAIQGIRLGKGSLTGSFYSNSPQEAKTLIAEIGAWHGRINLINREGLAENPGHGTVMPQMVHGGPGRAGGSEELGGIRGIKHFLQRVGIQGSASMISRVSGDWSPHAKADESPKHPFRFTFNELQIGQGIQTHCRTITETDIVNFGCLSWDHFYAHFDQQAAERSMFGQRVAHGYFVLSAAAGLFVDPAEGPVLANIGLEELRFVEPVYANDTIFVRLTCKQKTIKPHRDLTQPPYGEVKWLAQVYNQNETLVAQYVVLTLVKRDAV